MLATRFVPPNVDPWMSAWYGFLCGLGGLLILFASVYVVEFLWAPYKQRDEARKEVAELKGERLSCFEVRSLTGKSTRYEKSDYSAWAELEIKNSNPNVSLENVNVQIVELVHVFEKQDERGSYFLHEPFPGWNPSSVYWSERNASTRQFSMQIPPVATRYAMVAFHTQYGGGLGVLNTPNYPPMLESKMVIEVSSPNSRTYRGEYYIQYHPPSMDEFEFLEWDLWCKSHNVTKQPTPDREGSQL